MVSAKFRSLDPSRKRYPDISVLCLGPSPMSGGTLCLDNGRFVGVIVLELLLKLDALRGLLE